MRLSAALTLAALAACNPSAQREASPEPRPAPAPSATTPATTSRAVLRLGAPIEASARKVALADIAKSPDAFVGKTFATTGTVTAVCQHMGCWMELRDAAGEAHIRMAGHAFFVPKTASGHEARISATLVKTPEPEPACSRDGKKGCREEAAAQLGHPVAKLELVAQGVEIM